jgi:hypothetical protein
MAYIFKNAQGAITGSASENLGEGWEFIEGDTSEYLEFLENSLTEVAPFRESDIQLARVLEDLIMLLIERDMIRFTDFPAAAQKRLNSRQAMRKKTQLSKLMDDNHDILY